MFHITADTFILSCSEANKHCAWRHAIPRSHLRLETLYHIYHPGGWPSVSTSTRGKAQAKPTHCPITLHCKMRPSNGSPEAMYYLRILKIISGQRDRSDLYSILLREGNEEPQFELSLGYKAKLSQKQQNTIPFYCHLLHTYFST